MSSIRDSIGAWDEIGGFLASDAPIEPGWNVLPLIAGMPATITRIRIPKEKS